MVGIALGVACVPPVCETCNCRSPDWLAGRPLSQHVPLTEAWRKCLLVSCGGVLALPLLGWIVLHGMLATLILTAILFAVCGAHARQSAGRAVTCSCAHTTWRKARPRSFERRCSSISISNLASSLARSGALRPLFRRGNVRRACGRLPVCVSKLVPPGATVWRWLSPAPLLERLPNCRHLEFNAAISPRAGLPAASRMTPWGTHPSAPPVKPHNTVSVPTFL